MYMVVKDKTVCKMDFAVKSISAYIAPRGSTSDKLFTVLVSILSTAGKVIINQPVLDLHFMTLHFIFRLFWCIQVGFN